MIKKKAKFFGFVTILVIILTTTFSCTNKKIRVGNNLKPQTRHIKTLLHIVSLV